MNFLSKKTKIKVVCLTILVASVITIVLFKSMHKTKIQQKNLVIVAFGDSLIKGYGSTPGNDFISNVSRDIHMPIINLGINGNTTADGLLRIDQALQLKPTVIILLLGGNDFLQGVPQPQTFENLSEIISDFKQNNSKVILLGVQGGYSIDEYQASYAALAQQYNIHYIPNVLEGLIGNKTLMYDIVHPNDSGYRIIANKVEPVLKKVISVSP